MSDHVNITHPTTRRHHYEESVQVAQLRAQIELQEQTIRDLSRDLQSIFDRIGRGEQVELHYPDGQVVPITKARRRKEGEQP